MEGPGGSWLQGLPSCFSQPSLLCRCQDFSCISQARELRKSKLLFGKTSSSTQIESSYCEMETYVRVLERGNKTTKMERSRSGDVLHGGPWQQPGQLELKPGRRSVLFLPHHRPGELLWVPAALKGNPKLIVCKKLQCQMSSRSMGRGCCLDQLQ